MRLWWRHGRLYYRRGRPYYRNGYPFAWRACCQIGLHFMTYSFVRDGYYCECGKQYLLGEQIWRP